MKGVGIGACSGVRGWVEGNSKFFNCNIVKIHISICCHYVVNSRYYVSFVCIFTP